MKNLESRFLALNILFAGLLQGIYIVSNINFDVLGLAVIFLFYNLIVTITFFVHVINSWTYYVPKRRILESGQEKHVAVLIPTWDEPVHMIHNTLDSILQQDYPQELITIVIGDEQGRDSIKEIVNTFSKNYPAANIIYHIPPAKDAPSRKGEAKAGNLNSALDLVKNNPDIKYIETRDADDVVGNKQFLRDLVGQLEHDERLAFVQTIKTTPDGAKDLFGNKEDLFYRVLMLSKNKANSVFPCGSGLVWRKQALLEIDGFPTWNLVEDFQSGAEALRRNWKGMFIPLIGAIAQSSPQDIPNLYKQRGTWALDSIRHLLWGKKKGLSLKQRLHFAEPGLFYILSGLTFLYGFIPAFSLITNQTPIKPLSNWEFAIFYLPFALAVILYPISIAKKGNVKIGSVVNSMRIFYGLGPVYLKATFLAVLYGVKRKPLYKVTRKSSRPGIYIHMVLPQLVLVSVLVYAVIYHLINLDQFSNMNTLSLGWAIIFLLMNFRIITNSWYGIFDRSKSSTR